MLRWAEAVHKRLVSGLPVPVVGGGEASQALACCGKLRWRDLQNEQA